MWDTSSRFTAQTSSWCGSSSVSGSGYLSTIRPRQNDPGLRRWKSMYNLAPETPTRWFPSEFRTSRGESSFYPTGVERWLLDAHDRLDHQLDRLSTRDTNLSCNSTMMQMFDMKQKQLSGTQFDLSRERRSLHEKVLKLESDLLQMRSTLDGGGVDQLTGLVAPDSLSRDLEKQKKEIVEAEIYKLREALKDAEARAKTNEEERNRVLRDLQTAGETQQMMRNKMEEMEQRFDSTIKNHCEGQEELNEAINNKSSQACLDKAVLKLEDDVKELETKLREALSANDHLIQDKEELLHRAQNLQEQLDRTIQHSQLHHSESQSKNQKTEWKKEDVKALRENNEQLRKEAERMKGRVDTSQHQLQELNDERIKNSGGITAAEAERSPLIREQEELPTKTRPCEDEAEENCCQHRKSVEALGLEIQKLQDECLVLEAQVKEKEKRLQLQEEEHNKQDEMRVQCIVELKAVASHWTEKWQNVALTLQSTQDELEKLQRSKSRDDRKSDSDLRVELQKHKPEMEQKSKTQIYQDHGGQSLQTVDTEALTDLSSLVCEHPSDSQFHQNTQVWKESSEVESLRQKLAEKEKEMSEREHALRRLERLREMEKTEAQIRISALQLQLMNKVSEDGGDGEGLPADVSKPTSLQIDDCRRKTDQLPAEKHLKQLDKDDKPSVEDRKDKLICPVNLEMEEKRRMITEQLKSLFKEREAADSPPQTGTSSPQDWTPSFVRAGWDRRNWQQSSGLMPVFEEDEEDSDWPEEEEETEEEDATEETC